MKMITLFLIASLLICCAENEIKREAYALMNPPPIMKGNEHELYLDIPARVNVSEQPASRKLVRNGIIHFTTSNVKRTREDVAKLCKAMNGYISSEEQTDIHERLSINQQLRVPSDKFDELLLKTEQLAKHVDSRTVESKDVTAEFIDTESRLKTKRALEQRYLDLISKAYKVTELLTIETELGNVRTEIESMEGRLNYLKNKVDFSTLDVTYYEEKITDFGFAGRVGTSLATGWDKVLYFVIDLIAAWPIILIGGALLLFGARVWRRRKGQLVN